ncbi:MAG: type II/IV secretion system protein [Candidatus Kerfeldbacteria bacterium]|nr:type II/IV secretion system protein [Candidatus Kerfeldbacteria bacterium]
MAKRQEDDQSGSGVIIQLLTRIIQLGATNRASDVHIEPEGNIVRVRFRIDGILREVEKHPLSLLESIVSRVKVLAELDITERRKPQEGRFHLPVEDRVIDVRVSTFPTLFGENVSLRLLDKSAVSFGLEQLGMDPVILEAFNKMIKSPYGVIYVTGPNGSGKTTTLYSALSIINSVEKNITTLEDPVEYQLPFIRQTQIDPDVGLTFASGLRALLRQDPDIILVGEIRDTETGEIAVRAALTGHLVFTTLHTNDSIGALARLTDMGVEPVLIASSTIGVLAQRLVRIVCQTCREAYQPSSELRKELGLTGDDATLYRAKGCDQCGMSGYLGRTGIFELLEPDDEIRNFITGHASYDVITRAARAKGMKTLRDDGLAKAKAGITAIEEVYRVTSANPHLAVF